MAPGHLQALVWSKAPRFSHPTSPLTVPTPVPEPCPVRDTLKEDGQRGTGGHTHLGRPGHSRGSSRGCARTPGRSSRARRSRRAASRCPGRTGLGRGSTAPGRHSRRRRGGAGPAAPAPARRHGPAWRPGTAGGYRGTALPGPGCFRYSPAAAGGRSRPASPAPRPRRCEGKAPGRARPASRGVPRGRGAAPGLGPWVQSRLPEPSGGSRCSCRGPGAPPPSGQLHEGAEGF